MSTVDPVAALLADVSRPVRPRLDFEHALLQRLLAELHPVATSSAWRPRRAVSRWFLSGVSWRVRVALVLMAVLLLLAGIATATYFGVRGWVSAGTRGVQYQSDYRLATVFTSRGNPVGWSPGGNPVPWWTSLALGPGGHELYAMTLPAGAHTPKLFRVEGVDRGTRLHATQLLSLGSLDVPNWCAWPFLRPVSAASSGDVFFVVGGLDIPVMGAGTGCPRAGAMNDAQAFRLLGYETSAAESASRGGLGHLLLFARHPDGSRQLILSGGDLVRSKLFPPDWMEWEIAASAPDRVWLWVVPLDGKGPRRLFELIDPNADGNWSDRIVRRIELPASLASAWSWRSWQLAGEPSLPGDDRSRSVLAAAGGNGDFRIYRIADKNDDGDALDPGETRLLLERRHVDSAEIAPRVVVKDGVMHRELVVSGLSRSDRVSLVSTSGAVRDVARAFRGLSTVLAGPKGELYAITGRWDISQAANSLVVHRLAPAEAGEGTIGLSNPVARAAPKVSFPPPLPGRAPRLEFGMSDIVGNASSSWTIGVNGHGLRQLVSHVGFEPVCQSVDGRALAYTSDAEVPTEFFTYVARDGGQPKKVTERNDRIICPFAERWLVLYRPVRYRGDGSSVGSLFRHDLRTGRETVFVRGVDNRYALSPDATKLIYVENGSETLELVDLRTLHLRRLAGPSAGVLYSHGVPGDGGLRWSPDGTRVVYFTGFRRSGAIWNPRLHLYEHELRVEDVDTGATLTRLRIAGGPPSVAWSPDSTRLLVCASDRATESNCGAAPSRLVLIDLRTGSSRTVARGPLNLVGWDPSGTTFAYATPRKLFVVTAAGTRRLPTMKPLGACGIECPWLGWSPDGRYIGFDAGLTEKSPSAIQLVDVRTGRLRVLRPPPGYYVGIKWWRN